MRIAACLLLLAGCAKSGSKQEAASPPPPDRQRTADEAPDKGGEPAPAQPAAPVVQAPSQGTAAPAPGVPDDKTAKEAARSHGQLGPTDDPGAFRPLDQPSAGGGPKDIAAVRARTEAPEGNVSLAGLTIGTPTLDPKQDGSLVRSLLGMHQDGLDTCYVTARAGNPKLAGRITVTFTVEPNGTITSIKSASVTGRDGELAKCFHKVFAAIKLDKGFKDTAVKVSLPITFAPPKAK
jgi:hypothetical protein